MKTFDELTKDLDGARTAMEKAEETLRSTKTKDEKDNAKKDLKAKQDLYAEALASMEAALPPEWKGKGFWPGLWRGLWRVMGRFTESNMVGFGAFAIFAYVLFMMSRSESLENFLARLSAVDYARGVITAVVVLATALIAIILLFSAISTASSDLEKSFNRGKEVLTILVGICGTCLGFYFSSQHDSDSVITISAPVVELLDEGKSVKVTAKIDGGKGPWSYELSFPPGSFPNTAPAPTKDGLIIVSSTATAAPANAEWTGKLLVTDSANESKVITFSPPKPPPKP